MKRLVSILLLLIFLFNVGGYYIVFIGLHHRSDLLLTKKIESDQFSDDELVELKIPVTLPYPIFENGFERADGKFEHNGIFYKLVKQKLERDTVYIICVRDIESREIAKTLKDYVAKTNDLPLNSKALNIFGKFLKDFQNTESSTLDQGNGWSYEIQFADLTFNPRQAILAHHGPPPKA